ncbi:PadR family transcriptional regulator [Novosphingobium sp. Gsoil 351]|nr:PadR family transcriptional regulator [Novosphingobium sp. Gsoil 351]
MHGCYEGRRGRGPGWPMLAMMMGGRGRGRGGSWEWSFGDGANDFGPRQRSGGRGGPRGRMFAGGELRLLLLKLIGDETRHGYELIKAIEELTGGNYAPSPGVVYPTLSLLLDEGMIAEKADDTPRKAFTITPEGQTELSDRVDEAEALVARLIALNEDDDAHRAPPIGRAVGNLFAALRGRAQSGFDAETVHQVAEILDEAARKIERL